MIIIYSKLLKGYLVFKGISLITCDKDRTVAINKALNRLIIK